MLEESIEQFCQLGVGKDFLNWIPKAQSIKVKNNTPNFEK